MFDGTGRLCARTPVSRTKVRDQGRDVSGNALKKFKKDDDHHQEEEEEDSYSMIQ